MSPIGADQEQIPEGLIQQWYWELHRRLSQYFRQLGVSLGSGEFQRFTDIAVSVVMIFIPSWELAKSLFNGTILISVPLLVMLVSGTFALRLFMAEHRGKLMDK